MRRATLYITTIKLTRGGHPRNRRDPVRFSSYSVPTALALAVLVVSLMDANALTILDDGGTHTIDASNSIPGMGVDVMDGPGGPTTLNVVAGANIGVSTDGFFGDFSVLLRGSSVANITGGNLFGRLTTTDVSGENPVSR